MDTDANNGAQLRAAFPFAAVIGMEEARQAVLLLAVDPGLNGVLVAGAPGTAKSLLARSFRSLLPGTAFVEVPLGITEDRLLGGLDLERTLRTGRKTMLPGLLEQAGGGVLAIDEINLLDPALARHVARALGSFALVGTYDPEEGAPPTSLMDAVGLHVSERGCLAVADRIALLRRVAAFDRDPEAFRREFASETVLLRERIARARTRLPALRASLDQRRRLIAEALRLEVEGNRSDIYALRAALAHAALMGHDSVHDDDLEAAICMVLLPRAGALQSGAQVVQHLAAGNTRQSVTDIPEDVIVRPLECTIPESAQEMPQRSATVQTRARSGRRARGASEITRWDRGRCVRAVAARAQAARIALGATLRAAAPFQASRRQPGPRQPAVRITGDDLRFKQFKQKRGLLIVFAVDASGSMAMNRMNQAKGALIHLLAKAYLHRDQVALVSFRGRQASVLLAPTRSVDLAKRAVDALPAGGGTPLAAGLESALNLALRARPAGRETLLVLLSDGRANVPRNPGPGGREAVWRDVEQVCAAMRAERVNSVVIDTTHQSVSNGEAGRIAELLGGRLVHLPHPKPDAVCAAVSAAVEAARALEPVG